MKVQVTYYRTLEVTEEIEVDSEEEAHAFAKEHICQIRGKEFSTVNEEAYELASNEIDIQNIGLQITL